MLKKSYPAPVTRRDFLKLAAAGLGGLALRPWQADVSALPDFPQAERLGRVCTPVAELKARPDADSETLAKLPEDTVLPWLQEMVGRRPLWYKQNYVETPEGYIYSPNMQPVSVQWNAPVSALPGEGMWTELTVPYVDLVMANPPPRSPWLKNTPQPRLYYSQILWVDELKTDDNGQIWYRVNERYGSYGDIFWVPAEALRPLTAEEMSPISPDVENKRVEVDVTYQTMSCFEGDTEVFFCRVSTGGKYTLEGNPSDTWSTPVGPHHIWRKLVSIHMSGGTTGGGWDLPGIGWTSLFSGNGVAIHSTFWHNNYGVPTSHGCVNARPEDAKWVWRWTLPVTPDDTGDITVQGTVGTKVVVVES